MLIYIHVSLQNACLSAWHFTAPEYLYLDMLIYSEAVPVHFFSVPKYILKSGFGSKSIFPIGIFKMYFKVINQIKQL